MQQLLAFTELIRKFREVRRKVIFSYRAEPENDLEHSGQLALTAWYICSSQKLDLDLEKIFQYALAHDLVEAYAGDTPSAVHRSYEAERGSKEEREAIAAKRIKEEFPEFADLHEVIHSYERRADREARFVYALDKILPILNIYPDGGHSWKINDVRIEDVIEYKKDKIAESPEIQKYFEELVPMLRGLRL